MLAQIIMYMSANCNNRLDDNQGGGEVKLCTPLVSVAVDVQALVHVDSHVHSRFAQPRARAGQRCDVDSRLLRRVEACVRHARHVSHAKSALHVAPNVARMSAGARLGESWLRAAESLTADTRDDVSRRVRSR